MLMYFQVFQHKKLFFGPPKVLCYEVCQSVNLYSFAIYDRLTSPSQQVCLRIFKHSLGELRIGCCHLKLLMTTLKCGRSSINCQLDHLGGNFSLKNFEIDCDPQPMTTLFQYLRFTCDIHITIFLVLLKKDRLSKYYIFFIQASDLGKKIERNIKDLSIKLLNH